MGSNLPPTTTKSLRLPAALATMAFGGNLAAGRGLPTPFGPPVNASPVVTLSTSTPAATPTNIPAVASGVPNTAKFRFSGTGKVILPSNTYPYYTYVINQQSPLIPLGYGFAIVEFETDTPTLSIPHQRSLSAVQRLLVDNKDGRGFVEAYRVSYGERAATAQGGGSNTITLDSGSSSTTGFWNGYWVHITGGTGAGQYGQIQSYVGSTKVATMNAAWTTAPDNTSTFEITDSKAQFTNLTNSGVSTYFMQVSWSGERRLRAYKLENLGQQFSGINVASIIDTVIPAPKNCAAKWFWAGDSFSAATGADISTTGLADVCVNRLGGELYNLSIGGTGYLNPGASFTLRQRLLPPTNSWFVQFNGATGGSFTLTQNGQTATIPLSGISTAAVQSALNSAFGAGAFLALETGAATQGNLWVLGLGSNANVTSPMTANFSGVTYSNGSTSLIQQYLGELAPNVPLDGAGNALPFSMVLANGHNDTTDTNAAYTPAAVQAELTTLISQLVQRYPLTDIYVVGNMFIGTPDATVTACDAAIQAACVAALPLINGKLPFIETLTATLFTGTSGHAQAPGGTGSLDFFGWTDGVHPWVTGHAIYGEFIASAIQQLWGI